MSSAISLIRLTTSTIMCCSTASASHLRSSSLRTTNKRTRFSTVRGNNGDATLPPEMETEPRLPDDARRPGAVDVGEAPFEQPRPAQPIPSHPEHLPLLLLMSRLCRRKQTFARPVRLVCVSQCRCVRVRGDTRYFGSGLPVRLARGMTSLIAKSIRK
jgi:hypothetical protein